MIPVFVLFFYLKFPFHNVVAAAIFALAALTDALDGHIARSRGLVTNLGKFLDPIADKATQFTLIICLLIRRQNPVLLFLTILFVIKELFQLIAGFLILRKGLMLKGALIAGKISTAVLFISLIVLVLIPDISKTAEYIITGLDIAVLLYSFVSYARVYYTHSPMIQSIDENKE